MMKRYVLLVGGSGARVAEAMLCAACAGVFRADALDVLLADVDHRGSRSAELLRAKYADYDRMQVAVSDQAGESSPFHTQMNFRSWPPQLPGGAASISEWTDMTGTDALLCQALLDEEASALNMREGFGGRRTLGQVVFAGLLDEAERTPGDPLFAMIDEMNADCDAGAEVRVVLAGSVCGGTGAAGLPLLARCIREQTQGRVRLGAVLLAANGDHEDPAKARDGLAAFAQEDVCDAVAVLGLPMSSCSSVPADYAHLTDWLAVYSMDVLLHRPQWPSGVFTVKAPEGPLSWAIFGKAADRYRLAYGRLVKAAAAWIHVVAPQVEKRLRRPNFLRDSLFGWYAHFFRKVDGERNVFADDVAGLSRLMSVVLLWLGGLLRTLPPEMRYAAELSQARAEAEEHYAGLTALVSHLTMLDDDAQKDADYEDSMVHRHDPGDQSDRAQTMKRIDAVKQEIARRSAEQERMNRHIGGAAAAQMMQGALAAAEAAEAELNERYAEANRRIDHAESIAAPEDQYRITDARTKLERMTRHQQVLRAQTEYIRSDAERALSPERRYEKPQVTGAAEKDRLFSADFTARLLQERRMTRRDVEAMWSGLVLPADGMTLRQALKQTKKEKAKPTAPVMSLLYALIIHAMGEV